MAGYVAPVVGGDGGDGGDGVGVDGGSTTCIGADAGEGEGVGVTFFGSLPAGSGDVGGGAGAAAALLHC